MADGTHIQWTDATWNVVTGCTRISDGCDHCYIDRTPPFRMQHRRFDAPGVGGTTGVKLHSDRLGQPQRWRQPRLIFVCSLADLFHDDVPDRFIADVWAVMALAKQHSFQVLTKRPARMRALLTSAEFLALVQRAALARVGGAAPWLVEPWWPLRNVWCGVSVESQKWADIRIPLLLDTPAAVRWLSCEPLLGPVDLTVREDWFHGPADCACDQISCPSIDWVVVGGESGPGSRPMHPQWAESLRNQCVAAGVPFFFKQWGDWSPMAPLDALGRFDFRRDHAMANDGTLYAPGDLSYPDGPRYGEAVRANHGQAHLTSMYRVGKKTAGRELAGRTWDEFPAVADA
jgi:protein gp37